MNELEPSAEVTTPSEPPDAEIRSGIFGDTITTETALETEPADSFDDHDDFLGWSLTDPTKQLSPRHREVARLLFHGKSQAEICRKLGYSSSRMCILAANSKIRAEVERLRELTFSLTTTERLKEIGPESMDVIEGAIRGTLPVKARDRIDLAIWAVEQVNGRATQKVEHQSSTLDRYMEVLADMQSRGENPATIDVTPQLSPSSEPLPPQDGSAQAEVDWAKWLRERYPD